MDISLRDYFAAKVISGITGDATDIAEKAYEIADAMLKARVPEETTSLIHLIKSLSLEDSVIIKQMVTNYIIKNNLKY
jgi:hypothetical protein